jgi:hypothetical protein
VTLRWHLIAKAFGWRAATDRDDPTSLLVFHPRLRRHFSGPEAWKHAVRISIHAPDRRPGQPARKEMLS